MGILRCFRGGAGLQKGQVMIGWSELSTASQAPGTGEGLEIGLVTNSQ